MQGAPRTSVSGGGAQAPGAPQGPAQATVQVVHSVQAPNRHLSLRHFQTAAQGGSSSRNSPNARYTPVPVGASETSTAHTVEGTHSSDRARRASSLQAARSHGCTRV